MSVVRRAANRGTRTMWECLCDCGNIKAVDGKALKRGATKSCGCYNRDAASDRAITHGQTAGRKESRAYKAWKNIKSRCYNENTYGYKWYGAKGITMCAEWLGSFDAFYAHIGDIPAGMSIERIDNSKGYEPNNVTLIPRSEQPQTSSRVTFITYKGETKSVTHWADALGVSRSTLSARINKLGWSVERALEGAA